MKISLIVLCIIILIVGFTSGAKATVLTFDDLQFDYDLSGSNYGGLTWEMGNDGIDGNPGFWNLSVTQLLGHPFSPPHIAINSRGSTLMGITFSELTDVEGAYFAGQGSPDNWTTGIRVHGYREGEEIATTDWFNNIDETPDWFATDFNSVDRMVIECIPVIQGGGFYGMDNLTYSAAVPEPSSIILAFMGTLGLLSFARRKN